MENFNDLVVKKIPFKKFVRDLGDKFAFHPNKKENVFLAVDSVPVASASKALTADLKANGKPTKMMVVSEMKSSEEGRPNWFLVQYAGEAPNALFTGTV